MVVDLIVHLIIFKMQVTHDILHFGEPWSDISDYDKYQRSMEHFSEFLSDQRKHRDLQDVMILFDSRKCKRRS
jgi:hypothetical protein